MNDEQERIWKEAVILPSKHPTIIYWIRLRKITISSGWLVSLLRFE